MEEAKEIASILDSQLPSEDKLMLLSVYMPDTILPAQEINKCNIQEKIQQKEKVKTKEDNTVISKSKDPSPSRSSSQQSKADGSLDPFIIEALLDKSSVLAAILLDEQEISLSKVDTATTSQEVKLQGKSEDPKEKAEGGNHNLLNVETSEKIEKSISSYSPQQEKAKANVASRSEVNLKNKSANSGSDQKDDTSSSTSSKIKLKEIGRLTEGLESRVAPAESCRIFQENEVFIVKESDSNSDAREDETIHKQEAACKHCRKLISHESPVLKAKCGCTSSLIHEDCANAWSREKGNRCSHCEQEIQNKLATLSLKTSEENPETRSSASVRCCCFT